MTSDLGTEEVVVQITAPQIITSESVVCVPAAVGRGVGVGTGGAGTAVELGRRLLLAARAGDTSLVLDLMAKGAPFTTDWLGTSPLHLAATNGHADTCGVLLRAGVSRDSRTKVERTPLHLAAYAGHAHVAALLLEHGALVDCRDMLRMTPLHWAAQRGHAAAAAALLRHGADERATSKFLKTPQQLAAANGHTEVLALIDEAMKQREAAKSVKALVADRPPDEPMEPERQYTSIHKGTPQVKIRPKPASEKTTKTENKAEPGRSQKSESGAAALLRRHGITLLPADDGSTVLNALQSGRTVVLSDAGKLMLKESEDGTSPTSGAVTVAGAAVGAPASVGTPASVGAAVGARSGRGVVLTATPVRTPPAPGVKVFTLNNRLLTAAKSDARNTRIMTQQDFQQVKFVQLPSDARVVSPRKGARRVITPAATARAPVKIIMNKSNFSRLMAGAQLELDAPVPAVASTPVVVTPDIPSTELPSSLLANTSNASPEVSALRAELARARRDAAALAEQLRECRGRLAQYEPAQYEPAQYEPAQYEPAQYEPAQYEPAQ